jgi:hypothetical protein
MKKLFLILCLFVLSFDVYSGYSPYGGCFTPQGAMRGIVIFVGFDTTIDNSYVDGWSGEFPDIVENNQTYYTDISQFDEPITANDAHNVSRWYYEMSKLSGNPFKLMVDYYRVDLN